MSEDVNDFWTLSAGIVAANNFFSLSGQIIMANFHTNLGQVVPTAPLIIPHVNLTFVVSKKISTKENSLYDFSKHTDGH